MWSHTRADSADPPILPRRPLYLIQFRRPLLFPLGRESVRPFGSINATPQSRSGGRFNSPFNSHFNSQFEVIWKRLKPFWKRLEAYSEGMG